MQNKYFFSPYYKLKTPIKVCFQLIFYQITIKSYSLSKNLPECVRINYVCLYTGLLYGHVNNLEQLSTNFIDLR